MQSKWIDTLLCDVADLTVGFVGTMANEYVESGVPFLRSLNVNPYSISLADMKYITLAFSKKINKSELKPGDVVIVRTGKPGACAVIPENLPIANCSDLVVVRPDTTKIDPLFLVAYINSMASNQINANIVGAVQQHFNVASAKKIIIPLPNMKAQQKISALVLSINNKIQVNADHKDCLNNVINLLYQSWFSNFCYPNATGEMQDGNPVGWKSSNVFDNVTEVREKNKDNLAHPVLSVVKEGEFKPSDDVFTKQVYSKSTTNYKIVKRNQVGYNPARANIGSIAMLTNFDAGLVSPIYIVFELKESITPIFFYYYMKQPMFIEGIKHHAIGTTRQNFPFEAFKMFPMVVPPIDLQKRFEEIARPIEKKIAKLKEENEVLAEIRDTLLPKLISGELPVKVGEE